MPCKTRVFHSDLPHQKNNRAQNGGGWPTAVGNEEEVDGHLVTLYEGVPF